MNDVLAILVILAFAGVIVYWKKPELYTKAWDFLKNLKKK
jgi:hypothetical protein